jgi:hypothetical protein
MLQKLTVQKLMDRNLTAQQLAFTPSVFVGVLLTVRHCRI